MSFGFFVAALVLTGVVLIQDGGKSLLGWAVLLALALYLLWPRL
jgi:low temperature requirement protein LtrA